MPADRCPSAPDILLNMQTIWCWSGKDHHQEDNHLRPRPDSAQWFETDGRTDGRKASLYPSARQVTEVSIRQAKPEFLFALIFSP